jgi:hypothetical protein
MSGRRDGIGVRVGRAEGRPQILRRWISALPVDSMQAVRLAEEFRRCKVRAPQAPTQSIVEIERLNMNVEDRVGNQNYKGDPLSPGERVITFLYPTYSDVVLPDP